MWCPLQNEFTSFKLAPNFVFTQILPVRVLLRPARSTSAAANDTDPWATKDAAAAAMVIEAAPG